MAWLRQAPPSAARDAVGGAPEPAPVTAAGVRRGIGAICGAAILFTTSHAITKVQAADYHILQLIFFRSAFAFVPLAPFMFRDGLASLRTRRPGLHAVRCASGIASMLAFFWALSLMPLADLTAINFTMPLFVTALSVPFLAERVGWRRWTAVAIGFSGVLLMTRPGAGALDWVILIALLSAFLYAAAVISMRLLGSTERSATTTFYFTLASLLVSAAALPFVWTTPAGLDWLALVAIGIISGSAQLMMTVAYRYAPAAVIAPFDYIALVWAALLGYLLWGDVPAGATVAGAALVVGSGLFILYRETKLARERPDHAR